MPINDFPFTWVRQDLLSFALGLWPQGQANPGLTMLGLSQLAPWAPDTPNLLGTRLITGPDASSAHPPLGIVAYQADDDVRVAWLWQKKVSSTTYQLTLDVWSMSQTMMTTEATPLWSLALGDEYVTPVNTYWAQTPPNDFNLHRGLSWGHLFWDETNQILVVLGHGTDNLRKTIFSVSKDGILAGSMQTPYLLHQASYSNGVVVKGWWSNLVSTWYTGSNAAVTTPIGREQAGTSLVAYAISPSSGNISQVGSVEIAQLLPGVDVGYSSPSTPDTSWSAYDSVCGPEGRWPIDLARNAVSVWLSGSIKPIDTPLNRNLGNSTITVSNASYRDLWGRPNYPQGAQLLQADSLEIRPFGPSQEHRVCVVSFNLANMSERWRVTWDYSPLVVEDGISITAWDAAMDSGRHLDSGAWWGAYSRQLDYVGLQYLQVMFIKNTTTSAWSYTSITYQYTGYASQDSISYADGLSLEPGKTISGVSGIVNTSPAGSDPPYSFDVVHWEDVYAEEPDYYPYRHTIGFCTTVDDVTTTWPKYNVFPARIVPILFPLLATFPPATQRYDTTKKGYDLTAITQTSLTSPVGGVCCVDSAGVTWGAHLTYQIIVEGQAFVIPDSFYTTSDTVTTRLAAAEINGGGLNGGPYPTCNWFASQAALDQAIADAAADTSETHRHCIYVPIGAEVSETFELTINTKMQGKTVTVGRSILWAITKDGVKTELDVSIELPFKVPAPPDGATLIDSSLARPYLGQIYGIIPLPVVPPDPLPVGYVDSGYGVVLLIRDIVTAFYNPGDNTFPAIPFIAVEIRDYLTKATLQTIELVPSTDTCPNGTHQRRYQSKTSEPVGPDATPYILGIGNTANWVGARGCLDLNGNPWVVFACRVKDVGVTPNEDRIIFTRLVFDKSQPDPRIPTVTTWNLLNGAGPYFRSAFDTMLFAGSGTSHISEIYLSDVGFEAPTYPE